MKNNKEYLDQLFMETVRYAELERSDLSDSEAGMMIRSVWYLKNPIRSQTRENRVNVVFTKHDGSRVRFTAHAHDEEPLSESHDDILVYHSLSGEGETAHYIIDRFCPKKVR